MMALKNYSGPANSRETWPHLIGETVKAAFEDEGHLYIVFESGWGLALTQGPTGKRGAITPAFWPVRPDEIERRARRIEGHLRVSVARLGTLAPILGEARPQAPGGTA